MKLPNVPQEFRSDVNTIAATASAMTPVAAHPSVDSQPWIAKRPRTSVRAAINILVAMTGTATMHGASVERLDGVYVGEVDDHADHRRECHGGIESLRLLPRREKPIGQRLALPRA